MDLRIYRNYSCDGLKDLQELQLRRIKVFTGITHSCDGLWDLPDSFRRKLVDEGDRVDDVPLRLGHLGIVHGPM
jgi:hypothetical protein